MSGEANPYRDYTRQFPEESGHEWVLAPELFGRSDFESLLVEAVARGTALTQSEVDQRLGTSVEWSEGVVG